VRIDVAECAGEKKVIKAVVEKILPKCFLWGGGKFTNWWYGQNGDAFHWRVGWNLSL